MNEPTIVNLDRRRFLQTGLAVSAGLTLGVYLPRAVAESPRAGPGKAGGQTVVEGVFEPNAFVRIGTDDRVTVISKHLEMGQGTYTGMATLVAEELDARWDQIRVEGAPADAARYNNLFWGQAQGTGGSTAMANAFEQMRKAGAAARHMLLQAASQQWGVPPSELTTGDGSVRHAASKRAVSYGARSEAAAKQAVPEDVRLKDPSQFKLIGTRVSRVDMAPKIKGTAVFTQDVKLPGLLTAVVAHPPRFGARVESVDAAAAKQVKGVRAVVEIPSGVAVVAGDFWSAKQGRDALQIQWDESTAMAEGSAEIFAEYERLAAAPGATARRDGDVEAGFATGSKTIEAEFRFPYLAHAAMEPMNCVVQLRDGVCQVWNGEQLHTGDQHALAQALGIKPEQVRINMLYAGGSFGRRANPKSDYVLEAAQIAKAVGGTAPIKLVWTREDDTRAGWFRPAYLHRMRVALDDEGMPLAWHHRLVGQSIASGTAFEAMMVKDGVDQTSVEGASNMPYAVPNVWVDLHSPTLGVPIQWWRSVGSTHTAFAVEAMIDELASAAGQDPVAYRRMLLKDHPRHLGVLDLAAEKAAWDKPLPEGRYRGVAVHESFNSYVAQVAEVSLDGSGGFKVDRVVIAVDCGIAVNPDIITAQMEGGMGYGLAAALASEITLQAGAVVQSNFHDYEVLRINQMPAEVEVHIVRSTAPPSGVGEPGTPVIAPAVANALFAATGQRLRSLPLRLA